ncbi:MAG: thermonuclease family protein [Pyrinomonadaceae bacterium]|nr:thermonuclease family protein [Pyrinomonadaceae bacterium]
MRKIGYLLLSTSLVLICCASGMAQSGRADTAEARERLRESQRIIENQDNPFGRVEEESKPLKPKPVPRSPLRATVDLQVITVTDGDTLIISNTANQHLRLRIQGIDAPETGQSFGSDAQSYLAKLLTGKTVSIEFDPRGKPDDLGRVIAKVYLDGLDIGLEQIKAGLAWFCKDYKKEQTESDRYTYAESEKEARQAKRGLWKDAAPQSPWDYRQTQ